jgi:nucleotidyltransferase/DNA polymerase involved in DNA repair
MAKNKRFTKVQGLVSADKKYSVDEAFINLKEVPDQKLSSFIQELKERTEQWTGMQVSVGAGPTKVLSKVANRLAKKNKAAFAQSLIKKLEKTEIIEVEKGTVAKMKIAFPLSG